MSTHEANTASHGGLSHEEWLAWVKNRLMAYDPLEAGVEAIRFVRHPIARMTGVCSLVRRAMDQSESQPVRG